MQLRHSAGAIGGRAINPTQRAVRWCDQGRPAAAANPTQPRSSKGKQQHVPTTCRAAAAAATPPPPHAHYHSSSSSRPARRAAGAGPTQRLCRRAAASSGDAAASPSPPARLQQVLAAIDALNAQDPRRVEWQGQQQPYELVYSRWVCDWVARLAAAPSEELLITARGFHVERWKSPRSSYPEGRAGYLAWREGQKQHHAATVGRLMADGGYGAGAIEKVRRFLLKRDLKKDPENQIVEDAVCLVFLQHQFTDLLAKEGADKMVSVVAKTWGKMGAAGREAALALAPALPADQAAVVQRALAGEAAAPAAAAAGAPAAAAAQQPEAAGGEQQKPLVVVGSINADLVLQVDRLPAPGETLSAASLSTFPGGKGANQAAAAARLGWPTALVAQLGSDSSAPLLRGALEAAGVRLQHVRSVEGPSGTAVILLQASGENSILIVGGANQAPWELSPATQQLIASAGALLLQREIPEAVNVQAAEIAAAAGVPVLLDAGGVDAPLPAALLRCLTVITPNETELQRLTGGLPTDTPEQILAAAAALQQAAAKAAAQGGAAPAQPSLSVLVKCGSAGSMLVGPGGQLVTRQQAMPARVVDTTGAGDCFTAAYAVAQLQGSDAPMRFASAAASICVSRPGAMTSLPSREELDALLAGLPK